MGETNPQRSATSRSRAFDEQPLVSFIMAAWNSEGFIAEAIESARAQTYGNWELVVVDDASRDRTPHIVEAHAERDARVRLVRNAAQRGAASARNSAIRESGGEFVAVLDSNDVALPDRLRQTVPILGSNPEAAAVGGPGIMIDEQGREIGPMGTDPCSECDMSPRAHLAHGGNCFEVHPSVLMRRASVIGVGGYDEWFRYAHDYDLWLRLSEEQELILVSAPLVKVRLCLDGISSRKRRIQSAYAAVAYQRRLWKQRGRVIDLERTFQRALRAHGGGRDVPVWEALYRVGWQCATHRQFSLARSYFLRSFLARPRSVRPLLRAAATLLPGGGTYLCNGLRAAGRLVTAQRDGQQAYRARHVDPVFAD